VSITTCFGIPGDTQHIQNTWEDMRNINILLLYVPYIIWQTVLLQPTKRTRTMRNFTATLHLQQLHYVTNQQMLINKIYFLFQTLALFWMLYSFFWVIPPASDFLYQHFGTLCSLFKGLHTSGSCDRASLTLREERTNRWHKYRCLFSIG